MIKEIQLGMTKHCVIANITREPHIENGVVRYGTKVYPGGRKVYISRHVYKDEVVVMGLSRFKSHYVEE